MQPKTTVSVANPEKVCVAYALRGRKCSGLGEGPLIEKINNKAILNKPRMPFKPEILHGYISAIMNNSRN